MQAFKPLLLFPNFILAISLTILLNEKALADIYVQTQDEFIEDIIEIEIPGLKGAYNPSMVEFEDGYLMAFRYDSYKEPIGLYIHDFCQYIGLILLDENFKPKSTWRPCIGNRTYDPRLLKVCDNIYLIFASPAPWEPHSSLSSRLNLCRINYSEDEMALLGIPWI